MSQTICHVPGHGGNDSGTSHGGLVERDWVLAMALELEPYLGLAGCSQTFSRLTGDLDPSAAMEAEIARTSEAGLVLIHHVNASASPATSGMMVFAKRSDEIGREVGDAIMRACPLMLRRNCGKATLLDPADKAWPRVWNCMQHYDRPAVLIEYGFATSEKDRLLLTRPQNRLALIASVLAGVGRYLEIAGDDHERR